MEAMNARIYLVRIWDPYDDDWEIECACLTLEKAKAEQALLSKRGYKTNIAPVKLAGEENA